MIRTIDLSTGQETIRQYTYEELSAIQTAKPDPQATIKAEIYALEALLTQRRFREALLTGDNSYIENVDSQIAKLREQLG